MVNEVDDNAIVIEAWNTVLFEKSTRFQHILTQGLSGHSQRWLDQHGYARGARVLDVGCGFGDTTLAIAEQVGPDGAAVGMDCAENFVRAASDAAERAALPQATFFCADAQTDDLRGPYDFAFSRFGTMFFNLPGAAMRNLRRALAPGGELSMIVWRRREDNPWLHAAELRVREIVPVIEHDQTDQVHCGPGPFSMAGPDMVSTMLVSAGFDRVRFERCDLEICIGRSLEEALSFAMALGPAGEILRLAGEQATTLEPQVEAALKDALADFLRPDGSVWAPSSTWFVSARNPVLG